MRKQFFTLFVIISISISAQNFDSLVHVSNKISSDTQKVNLFYSEGFKGRFTSPQFAYDCAKQAEYFGKQSNSQKHLAKAYNLMGVLYYRKGDLKKALIYHKKALEIRETIGDEIGIAHSETNLGNIYTDLNKTELAEQSYMASLQINHKLNNEKQTANCYINIGVLKMGEKKYGEAEKYFLNAYKIAKTIMDYEVEAMCLNNLAVVNIENKSYESAIGNCIDALKAKEIMGNEMEKTDSYINLAKAYFELGDQINSYLFLNKADSLCNAFEYTEAKCELIKLKYEIAEKYNDYATALNFFKEYVNIKESIAAENKELTLSNNFTEEKTELKNNVTPFSFPYLMLLSIVVLSLVIAFIIFNNKR